MDDLNTAGLTNEQLFAAFLDLQTRMLQIQQQQAKALELQNDRTAPKENPNYTPQSIFIDPATGKEYRELLKCEMYFGPIRLNRTPITAEECEALNRLQPVEKATITKTDGSSVRVDVIPVENVVTSAIEKLTITLPMRKEDNPQHYPSLRVLALQLAAAARQPAAVA